ncbi:MAG: rRNA maturation RNase YbeY [Mycoplasmataceae bacterium]|nr:rRNA maturation RNase YbeY [Mycoplasmataceae bacterium]
MISFSLVDKKHQINKQVITNFKKVTKYLSKQYKTNYYFDVSIVDSKQIKTINNKYRHINKVTDVISFALFDAKSIKTNLLGEIFICYQKAKQQANEYGHSLNRELTFLFIHGLLHLLGYDHLNKKQEHKMFLLQKKLMNNI